MGFPINNPFDLYYLECVFVPWKQAFPDTSLPPIKNVRTLHITDSSNFNCLPCKGENEGSTKLGATDSGVISSSQIVCEGLRLKSGSTVL